MPNKLTDAEVKKALEEYINFADLEYTNHTSIEVDILKNALDLINRQDALIDKLEKVEHYADKTIATLNAENESLKAEVERLQNAYKQCAWERDIFAEDMTQEIKKDCSYLMLDIKTIKAEAYKEFAERLKEKKRKMLDYDEAGFSSKITVVSIEEIDNILNELVGDGDD